MDTSEQYIKMRVAAIPDLGMGIPMGFSINWRSETILIDEKGDWYYSTKDGCVQLERQDQLQEMYCDGRGGRHFPLEGLIKGFTDFVFNGTWQLPYDPTLKSLESNQFTSMEQLWLAFVMKEKFKKMWSGNEWVE